MTNLNKIIKTRVTPEVGEFCNAYLGNHVAMFKGWKKEPKMGEDLVLLEQQLAYAIGQKRHNIAKRVLGRIRSIKNKLEDAELARLTGKTEDRTIAPPCLD